MTLLIRLFHSPSMEPTSSGPSQLSTPKSAGGPAISSQPKTTWPPPSHVTPPPYSFGRARPTRSAGGARRKLWTGLRRRPRSHHWRWWYATLLIHERVKAEEIYEKTRKLPDPASTDNAKFQIGYTRCKKMEPSCSLPSMLMTLSLVAR